MRRSVGGPFLLLSLGLLSGACGDSISSRSRQPGSAFWVTSEAELTVRALNALGGVSIREVFAETAELVWESRLPELESLPQPDLPRRTTATLVVTGSWASGELEVEAIARSLAQGLQRLKIEAESRGLLPLGFHFDVDASGALESYGEVLRTLAGEIDSPLLLSASVQPDWLDQEGIESLARGVHFLVPFLYGQRIGAEEESQFWDLGAVVRRIERLEELGTDYLVGLVTLGSLSHVDREGERLATTSLASVSNLLENRSLEFGTGFTFEGFYRQVFDLEIQRPTKVGEWTLRPGDRLRVSRPMSAHVEGLVARLESLDLEHHLGELYYRSVSPGEDLSLSLDHLMGALAPEPATPELEVGVELLGRSPSVWVLSVELHNRNFEGTEVALQDFNYVELKVAGGVWGKVEPGEFRRAVFRSSENPGFNMAALRNADILHLQYPILDGEWSVKSGPVRLQLRGRDPQVTVGAKFVLPGGRSVDLPPQRWEP